MLEKKDIKITKEAQEISVVSEIWEEMQLMKAQPVTLEQVYLDPNNPRLEILKLEPVADERFVELGIQQACLEQLRNFGLNDLVENIRTSGFCTIDRVVLRRFDEDKYIVVEGNRRVAALKLLQEDHSKGRITLPKSILKGILKFQALVYKGDRADIAWIIQGFRHAPEAIKEWEDFSKAKFFAELEGKGKNATEIAKMFSVRPRRKVSNLTRSYQGFQQAKEDEDYGDQLDPDKHFSFFNQIIFVKPELKEWLDWNELEKRFRNPERLNKFLSWITLKKVDISPTTRDYLPQLLLQPEYKDILEAFESEEGLDIHECRRRVEERKPKPPPDISGILMSLRRIKGEINMLPLTPISQLGQLYPFQAERTAKEKEQKNQILALLIEIGEAIQRQIKMLSVE